MFSNLEMSPARRSTEMKISSLMANSFYSDASPATVILRFRIICKYILLFVPQVHSVVKCTSVVLTNSYNSIRILIMSSTKDIM